MRIHSILSVAALAGGLTLFCQSAQAAVSEARQDTVAVTDIVDYQCTATGVAEKQDIKVKIELTMPTDATTGEQMTIGWRGTYADDTALRAPATGLASGTKLYAYASISGLAGLTSATGVGELATLSAGQNISLPMAAVSLKTRSSNAGTATVRPGAINFGTRPNEPSIQCEVRNATALATYTLTVASANGRPTGSASQTPSPQQTPTATATASGQPTDSASGTPNPLPTLTVTATVTRASEEGDGTVATTPLGGAATGGGGESGPDGRVMVLVGFLLTLAAAAGLLLRRHSLTKG
ncbi:hypothetical protein IMZ11_21445 [Microtetraspora sp. AC03309]|uniref:hypothetical protein n=1 Tax=Microtetraspora sp. AC03309 TaxID=2779376 RepID=UPI001E2AC9E7|nr:hypothetical protein [Microtetraspora sp. AC03309]MCC5578194.1 hypothetical protein [Microtetraspora sp. AC03309]